MSVLTTSGKPFDWWDVEHPDPTRMVMWEFRDASGRKVLGSLRTIAHIDDLNTKALRLFNAPYVVIQPPFNTGVAASKGTHDLDVMRDWWIPGVAWWTMQRFGRANGEFCWYRHPPLFGNHIHGGTLPIPEGRVRSDDFATKVGVFVPGQLVDYYAHAFGLANQHRAGSDTSWFPNDIDATVFNLDRYTQTQRELTMQYTDWSKESRALLAADIAKAVLLDQEVRVRKSPDPAEGFKTVSVKAAIGRAGSATQVSRETTSEVLDLIDEQNGDPNE